MRAIIADSWQSRRSDIVTIVMRLLDGMMNDAHAAICLRRFLWSRLLLQRRHMCRRCRWRC